MKAVILSAGTGTRMRPLTWTRPKPMLPVAGAPILEYVLQEVSPHVEEFVLVTGYAGDVVRDYFGEDYCETPIKYVPQEEPHGTAHAIERAEPYVDDRFLAINGDIIFEEPVIDTLRDKSGFGLAIQPVSDPSQYGIVRQEDGRVTAIHEKPNNPSSNLANLGIYSLTPDIFDHIESIESSKRGEFELTDALTRVSADGKTISAVEYTGPWMDLGQPWQLLEANTSLLEQRTELIKGEVEYNATTEGKVIVEKGARVRAGSYIEGPTLIKTGADIGPNAYIRGHTAIGENVRIGNAVEIKNSIVMARSSVGHQSYVGDSILGSEVNLGAGTNVANLRHDENTIKTKVKGTTVDTGRRKYGVVLGDKVKTGINTSLNAGVALPSGATTVPGETVMETPPGTTEDA